MDHIAFFCKKSQATLYTVYVFVWIANRVCVTLMAVACEKIRSAAFFALCPRAVHNIILGAACTLSHRTHMQCCLQSVHIFIRAFAAITRDYYARVYTSAVAANELWSKE
jgi:hypothetical protein